MKTLSIRQPWAWLIVHGIKSVENRSWNTQFRGRFLIHASVSFGTNQAELDHLRKIIRKYYGIEMPLLKSAYQRGGIVGNAILYDVVRKCRGEVDQFWHDPDSYGFLLSDPQELPFLPMKGKLHFFDVNYTLTLNDPPQRTGFLPLKK